MDSPVADDRLRMSQSVWMEVVELINSHPSHRSDDDDLLFVPLRLPALLSSPLCWRVGALGWCPLLTSTSMWN